ncbi:methylenetetrahydrofolate dehydrogenase (nad) [Phaffia rhodozyma]|uniref:Methylenetetrahydrofolate dehydrogenase (Nad ) n=1 Tax=Phaffia rhodozyma TaxID=264483 RepID=A0A0F7SYS6_PHARH|nr:methylenetetrahydrofolate dehydrogenase (nad) [Phaffia rhodozyma]
MEGQGITLTAVKMYPPFKKELTSAIEQIKANGGQLKLVGILGTAKEDAKTYAEFTKRSCEALGITFELRLVGQAIDSSVVAGEGVEEAIVSANNDDDVGGLMVYYPIFGGTQDQYLQQVVSPLKDVEGLNHQFVFNLYHNIRYISPLTFKPTKKFLASPATSNSLDTPPAGLLKSILPCTPLAIVKTLEYTNIYNPLLPYGDRARGRTITVINRSEVVGRPLAALLANDGARVLSADINGILEFSKRPSTSTTPSTATEPGSSPFKYKPSHVTTPTDLTLQAALAMSDVVISAVPGGKFKVQTGWLKDGVVCVDIAGEKNFDTDVLNKASIYIPAVGKLTIAMLQRNLIRLRGYQEINAKALEAAAAAGLM